jgi:hypothetical protein
VYKYPSTADKILLFGDQSSFLVLTYHSYNTWTESPSIKQNKEYINTPGFNWAIVETWSFKIPNSPETPKLKMNEQPY